MHATRHIAASFRCCRCLRSRAGCHRLGQCHNSCGSGQRPRRSLAFDVKAEEGRAADQTQTFRCDGAGVRVSFQAKEIAGELYRVKPAVRCCARWAACWDLTSTNEPHPCIICSCMHAMRNCMHAAKEDAYIKALQLLQHCHEPGAPACRCSRHAMRFAFSMVTYPTWKTCWTR